MWLDIKFNKSFIDIILCPGLRMPRNQSINQSIISLIKGWQTADEYTLYFATLSLCTFMRPATAECDVIHKTGSTIRSAMPPEEDRATATGDPHIKFRANRPSGSRDMSRTNRHTNTSQTDAQTDRLITVLRTLAGRSNNLPKSR